MLNIVYQFFVGVLQFYLFVLCVCMLLCMLFRLDFLLVVVFLCVFLVIVSVIFYIIVTFDYCQKCPKMQSKFYIVIIQLNLKIVLLLKLFCTDLFVIINTGVTKQNCYFSVQFRNMFCAQKFLCIFFDTRYCVLIKWYRCKVHDNYQKRT